MLTANRKNVSPWSELARSTAATTARLMPTSRAGRRQPHGQRGQQVEQHLDHQRPGRADRGQPVAEEVEQQLAFQHAGEAGLRPDFRQQQAGQQHEQREHREDAEAPFHHELADGLAQGDVGDDEAADQEEHRHGEPAEILDDAERAGDVVLRCGDDPQPEAGAGPHGRHDMVPHHGPGGDRAEVVEEDEPLGGGGRNRHLGQRSLPSDPVGPL